MNNNPFRKVPSTNPNIEDWGKTKFKPKNLGNDRKNYSKKRFGMNKTFDRKFDKRETYRINEVPNDTEPYNSTPWNKYKEELVYKQQEEESAALQSNMESNEAKAVLKEREINYRKSLIQQKKLEPTKWEDFGDEEQSYQHKTKTDKYAISKNGKSNANKNQRHKRFSKSRNTESSANEFISKELLLNFDSKKLNYKQNDKLRGAITKTTIMASGCSLEGVVKAIKKKKAKTNKNKM